MRRLASAPIKIAVAGGGFGAKAPLPAYSELDEFEPVAAWSRREERARERRDLIEIHGEGGTVRLDAERRLWSGRAGDELSCEGPLEASSSDAFRDVARNLDAADTGGDAARPLARRGTRPQALIDAMRQADGERRRVEVEDVAASSDS